MSVEIEDKQRFRQEVQKMFQAWDGEDWGQFLNDLKNMIDERGKEI